MSTRSAEVAVPICWVSWQSTPASWTAARVWENTSFRRLARTSDDGGVDRRYAHQTGPSAGMAAFLNSGRYWLAHPRRLRSGNLSVARWPAVVQSNMEATSCPRDP